MEDVATLEEFGKHGAMSLFQSRFYVGLKLNILRLFLSTYDDRRSIEMNHEWMDGFDARIIVK